MFQSRRPLARPAPLALLAALLAAPPLAAQIPTPESVLGHRVGADFHLATFEESLAYFQRLDGATDRLQLRQVGESSFGRPVYIALISSAANLQALDRHLETARRLAHPEGLGEEEARQLARDGKAIVWIDGGLHATEVAHAQHTIQLAYDLVTGDGDPEIQAILDNVILMLWPSINPDGQTLVAEWYRSNLGTPYEVAPTPFLYQKYIGHDNNRDGYMINQIESRMATRVAREYEPQILYNHHQSSPFPTRIWIPPFAEPVSPYVHPLMWRTVNLIGMSMAAALEERGQKGATHMGTGFDNWYPGFMDHANNFHNVVSLLTETALYRYATPHFYTIEDFPARTRDLRPQSLYSSPWAGGWWHLRDAVDYMLTASISVLDIAAKYKTDLLYNRYQAGRDVIEQYTAAPPYAYFISPEQADPVAAVEMLRRLAFNGIEVHRLTQAVTVEGVAHAAGTWVIPMDQPFANYVRQLFDVQEYPDLREYPEGPPDQPYDVSGWTLPYQMGVRVVEAAAPLEGSVRDALEPVRGEATAWDADVEDASAFDSPIGVGFDSDPVATAIVPPPGRISGGGNAVVIDARQNNAFRLLNRAWAAGAQVRFQAGTPAEDGSPGTSGHFLVSGFGAAETAARDLHVQTTRANASGPTVQKPRIGLYRPWDASMDEGWTRWVLERFDFDFQNVYNADVLAGQLRDRYDVLVVVDMSGRSIMEGFAPGSVPARYAGGLGPEGVRAVDAFVRAGGTLVTLNNSALWAIDQLHLPVRNVVADVESTDFFMSGSIVEMEVDPAHPLMSGMPNPAAVVVGRSPVFTTDEGFEGAVFAKYPENGSPLMSGYLLGEEHLNGYAAGVDVKHGEGRVILLGMKPQWRGQPFGNFRILFNAALYTQAVAGATPDNSAFWTPPEVLEDTATPDEGRSRR
ncbi:MAG: M14 family metallopeptidase [Gemmatimonadota bacterium]|nr:hypothetical protein [Gemmatimonadota bacterium]